MRQENRTLEAKVLDRYPDIRRVVTDSAAFADWLSTLTTLEVDGETLYVRAGDILRDRDQIMFEWARQNGLLTDAAIARALEQRD